MLFAFGALKLRAMTLAGVKKMQNKITRPLFAAMVTFLFSTPNFVLAQNTPAPSFADIFTDNAVLQRGKPIAVWGQAAPNSEITIAIAPENGLSRPIKLTTDAYGEWRGQLPSMPKGGPYRLSVSSVEGSQTTLKDVMIGDVFLCSGQSNMEWSVRQASSSDGEIGLPPQNNLRYITIPHTIATSPQKQISGDAKWQTIDSSNRGDASAVCYQMAKNIAAAQNVTVGMINSYWGGSQVEAWISRDNLGKFVQFKDGLEYLEWYARDSKTAQNMFAVKSTLALVGNDTGFKEKFYENDYPDANWARINSNLNWEEAGIQAIADFDGIGWYRIEIELTGEQARNASKLSLGPIDDRDLTYINGQLVGDTSGWDRPREYSLKPNLFRAGKNVIAIQVIDTGGGGGPYGDRSKDKIVLSGGGAISLPPVWAFNPSSPLGSLKISNAVPWGGPNGYTTLYNGMIAPLAPYTIAGITWYQGESNAARAGEYRELLPAMIKEWRKDFNDEKLPFIQVQLSSFGRPNAKAQKSNWGELREAQRQIAKADPMGAMVVSHDIGDRTDIHPTQKTVVGQRMASAMRNLLYNENQPQSPTPLAARLVGNKIEIEFAYTYDGLKTYSSSMAIGFEVCDAQRKCDFVSATPNGNKVSINTLNPRAVRFVRYAWADVVYSNLFNSKELPIGTFEIAVER